MNGIYPNDFHGLLTLLVFLPALFALVVGFLPKTNARAIQLVALVGTLAALLVSVFVYAGYDAGSTTQFQLIDKCDWISSLHINYFLGLDGISLLMVLMTTAIWPFVVGVSFKEVTQRSREYYAWVLVMETAVLGVFLSLNLVLYYVFWEAMLIPDVFPHRHLGWPPAHLRHGQVFPVYDGRLNGDAGLHHGAVFPGRFANV